MTVVQGSRIRVATVLSATVATVLLSWLLIRTADVFLARRADADGWLVKPLDALRLRRAADAVLGGGSYTEGIAS